MSLWSNTPSMAVLQQRKRELGFQQQQQQQDNGFGWQANKRARPNFGEDFAFGMQQQQQQQQQWAAPQQQQQQFQQQAPVAQMSQQMAQPALGPPIGEVRYATPEEALVAVSMSGSDLDGSIVTVTLDERSKDRTRVIVRGLPEHMSWSTLKQAFGECGHVAYADIKRHGTTPRVGQARFQTPGEAQQALGLNGSIIDGNQIQIKVHAGSKDATKLQIVNLPPTCEWQDLKDFFSSNGLTPIFADVASAPNGAMNAEVRFEDPTHAQFALANLNGSMIGGSPVTVSLDTMSPDGTKLLISGIPAGIDWQEIKDHFGQAGTVAFVKTDADAAKGKGKGKGKMNNDMMKGMYQMMEFMENCGMNMQNMFSMMQSNFGGASGSGYKGGGKGSGKTSGHGGSGEVRFASPDAAANAAMHLNGSGLNGSLIQVGLDQHSQDGTKIWVSNLAAGTSWQDMKDHFSQAGQVAFAKIHS